MAITQFIPKEERQQQSALIHAMAQAVYGTAEDAAFTEEFVPVGAQPKNNKALAFGNFITNMPTCLWALFDDDTQQNVVGFILIADKPHTNSIGFGIKKAYARQGLMKKAWEEIKNHPCINYPLHGFTSKRNNGAIAFMERCGFKMNGETNFMGEDSWGFERKNSK